MEKEDIIQVIQETIITTVNGKIDLLHANLKEYTYQDNEWKKESLNWRINIENKLDDLKPFANSLTFIGTCKSIIKETVSWLVPLATITAIVGAVYHYFKN